MNIQKVVFVESDNIIPLKNYSIVISTDYGTNEILLDTIKDIKDSLDTLEEKNQFDEELCNCLGDDVVKALMLNEIDFILVV